MERYKVLDQDENGYDDDIGKKVYGRQYLVFGLLDLLNTFESFGRLAQILRIKIS